MKLNPLFCPTSIAIIGASGTPGSVGNDICKNLVQQGYQGGIFPVNPHVQELYGKKSYATITDISDPVDLVIIAIPSSGVASALEESGKKGVKAAVVISAGFREFGKEGELREATLKVIAHQYDIALLGPNCLGVINPALKMNGSFAGIMPSSGSIAFVSQSGALCSSVLDYSKGLGIGFSKFVSIGNKACIDEVDLIEYLADDIDTKVIIMYTEQVTHASRFIDTVRKITSGPSPKPIIILKAGRTQAGASASASHTGSLGTNDVFIDSIFKKAGVTRANTIEELFDYAIAFSMNPPLANNRIAVLTNAGGPGVLTADEVVSEGLQLASLSLPTMDSLRSFLPPSANVNNPVDILGDAKSDRYAKAMQCVMGDDGVDGLIVILTPQTMTEEMQTAEAIVSLKSQTIKPIVVSFMGHSSVQEAVAYLQQNGIATVQFPEYAAKSLGALFTFTQAIRDSKDAYYSFTDIQKNIVHDCILSATEKGKLYLPESDARPILSAYGFPLLQSAVIHSQDEVKTAVEGMKGLVAMKIMSQDIVHKSDVGGVSLHVHPNDIVQEYDAILTRVSSHMPNARIDGVLVTEMAPPGGLELIIGASKDVSLGLTMLMLGMGGVYVEVFKDVVFAPVPATKKDISDMISDLLISKILKGVRGSKPYDIPKLMDLLGRLSQLMGDHPEIKELDINPLIIYPEDQGALVVDSRIGL